jgi:glycosyltransferase involved in cell wall biosynthesis
VNILLINHYAGSPAYGMEFRPYFMAREWLRSNHQVTITAASYTHLRSRLPQVQERVAEEVIDGIRYIWIKTPAYSSNGVGRARNIFAFTYRLFLLRSLLAASVHPDVVIASSTYPLDIYPARAIAGRTGARLIFEVHDLWPLSPLELGGMSKYNPFIVTMQLAENYACRHADKVVSMLPKAEEHLRDHGMAAGKFVHVPNGIVAEEWNRESIPLPEPHAGLIAGLKRNGRLVVGYAGAHGLANALGTLVEAAGLLTDVPVDFVLVGQGQEREALIKRAAGLGLTNIHFLPAIPREAIPSLLRATDALYIGLQRQPLFRFGISPNKLMDYMMAAVPVIQAIEAGNDLVTDSGCGFTIPPEDPRALAECVKKMMMLTPEERSTMGLRGKEYVLTHNSYQVLAKRFEQAFSS